MALKRGSMALSKAFRSFIRFEMVHPKLHKATKDHKSFVRPEESHEIIKAPLNHKSSLNLPQITKKLNRNTHRKRNEN
jgi:hypothetical protein